MRILIALSDRDLLTGYAALLTSDGEEVVTAFDGAQAAAKLQEGGYDLAILDAELSRIGSKQVLRLLNETGVPSVMLLKSRPDDLPALEEQKANAYLAFPFFPDELRNAMASVMKSHDHTVGDRRMIQNE